MIKARSINDETIIYEIEATSNVKNVKVSSTNNHNSLYNRNLPNQHSIDSITGLREALDSGADKNYVHEQATPSNKWVIHHNLNKRAGYIVVDSTGEEQEAVAKYIDDNTVELYFNSPFTGKAYFN